MPPQTIPLCDSILQWNINGLKANRNELKNLLSQHNPSFVALNESKSSNPKLIVENSFKNYSLYQNDAHPDQGNLLLVRKDVNYTPFLLNTPVNAIAIQTNRGGRELRICSMYLSPNIPISLPDLTNLIEQLSPHNLPHPLIILGDFNARSEYWHDSINNSRGNQILDFILNSDLQVLNDDSPTHFNLTHGCQTNIDLSLCTRNLAPDLFWRTHPDLCSSDHYPILIYFLKHSMEISRFRWKFHRANWPLFTHKTRLLKYDEST